MDRLISAGVGLALLVGMTGCQDDAPGDDFDQSPAPSIEHTPTTPAPETGGIDVPEIPGTFQAAIPSLGFGIAVPEGWQATVLTDEAIERLEAATLSQPAFLEAALRVKDTGAVFYAAGVDDEGRVGELKVDVQSDGDTTPEGLATLAETVVDSGVVDPVVVNSSDGERVRVDYRLPGGDDGEALDTIGSQLFVPDGSRVWSFIVTSEDEVSQSALLAIFEASIAF